MVQLLEFVDNPVCPSLFLGCMRYIMCTCVFILPVDGGIGVWLGVVFLLRHIVKVSRIKCLAVDMFAVLNN